MRPRKATSLIPPLTTLKDIAAEVGTSVPLVSKVLNNRLGSTRVSESTRLRILEAAERLNYRKNSSAETILSGLHNTLGVLVHYFGESGSPLVSEMVKGIADEAKKAGIKLLLTFVRDESEMEDALLMMHRGYVDGVILGGVVNSVEREIALNLFQTGIPMITILEQPLADGIPNLGIDAEATGSLPTAQLIASGCKRIATINVQAERYRGYCQELERHGMHIDDRLLFSDGSASVFGYQMGVRAATHWLKGEVLPDGVVAQSDNQAMGVMNTFREAGVRCPEDVKITGVDNSPFCEFLSPFLTSVDQRSYERGRLAMKAFLQMREGKTPTSQMLPPDLFIRDSSRRGAA